MGKSQRNKGAAGERELSKILADRLGIDCHRNLEQTRSGGADLLGVGPWAVEIKRQERLCIEQWWAQACAQSDAYPALAYRQSRQPWTIIIPLGVLCGYQDDWLLGNRAALSIDGFCYVTQRLEIGHVDTSAA